MNLLDEKFFKKLKKQRNRNLVIFLVLSVFFIAFYIVSFYYNLLAVSLSVGIIEVIILVLFYYGTIFDKSKLLKLYKNINRGITQEDSYIFKKYDDETEHDGVKLIRLVCSFTDDGEEFERTLYFLQDLPHPALEKNQSMKVKTYQNIILNIED